jgi:hypothetical protein
MKKSFIVNFNIKNDGNIVKKITLHNYEDNKAGYFAEYDGKLYKVKDWVYNFHPMLDNIVTLLPLIERDIYIIRESIEYRNSLYEDYNLDELLNNTI